MYHYSLNLWQTSSGAGLGTSSYGLYSKGLKAVLIERTQWDLNNSSHYISIFSKSLKYIIIQKEFSMRQ